MRQIATRLAPLLAMLIVAATLAHGRAPVSHAAFHLAVINEVGIGTGEPQYVEIKFLADGQTFISNTRLTVFSMDGLSFTVLKLLPPGSDLVGSTLNKTILYGSTATIGGEARDFDIVGAIPAAGQVCWGAPAGTLFPPADPNSWPGGPGNIANYVDCVAYGGTNAFNIKYPPRTTFPPGDGTLSLTRTAVLGIHNNSTEYDLMCPTPANFADVGSPGSFGACTTPPDIDVDGVPDHRDNCPNIANGPSGGPNNQLNSDSGRLGVGVPKPDRTNPDGDGDGDACDADNDNDGLSDTFETMTSLTSPSMVDTDGDVWTDYAEYLLASDPLNVNDHVCHLTSCVDGDADGIPNDVETVLGTNPASNDTDADGVRDGTEFRFKSTDAADMDKDTDNDGCGDRREVFALDGDNAVAFGDFVAFANSYFARGPAAPGGPAGAWDANKDFDGDSFIAFTDFNLFAQSFSLFCPPMVGLAP